MGIINIHLLIDPVPSLDHQVRVGLVETMVHEHRLGYHDYGQMRRECPLCQQNK